MRRLKRNSMTWGHRLKRYNCYKQRLNGAGSGSRRETLLEEPPNSFWKYSSPQYQLGQVWGIITLTNAKSSMDVQIRLRMGCFKSAKRKGADLTSKAQEVDWKSSGGSSPWRFSALGSRFCWNRLALHDSSLRHVLAQVHLSEWRALVSVSLWLRLGGQLAWRMLCFSFFVLFSTSAVVFDLA